jgi:hypothetical protein
MEVRCGRIIFAVPGAVNEWLLTLRVLARGGGGWDNAA